MEFGIFGSHDTSLEASVRTWRRINEIGIGAIGVVDSPLLLREAFVSLATVAIQTDTPRLFPCVMNTITRDPTVVAGGYQGLRDLAGDRVSLAFGAGDSSTHGVGLGTAKLAHMEEFITTVRGLLKGETVQYQGRTLRGSWRDVEPFEPHLMVSAHGRRSLELAGRVADDVISGFGLLPETVAEAERIVRTSAEQAGRDPDAIEIWHVAFFSPADTVEEGFVYANGAGADPVARRAGGQARSRGDAGQDPRGGRDLDPGEARAGEPGDGGCRGAQRIDRLPDRTRRRPGRSRGRARGSRAVGVVRRRAGHVRGDGRRSRRADRAVG